MLRILASAPTWGIWKEKNNTLGTCNGQEVDTLCERAKGRQRKKKKKTKWPHGTICTACNKKKTCSGFNVFRRDLYTLRCGDRKHSKGLMPFRKGLLICHNWHLWNPFSCQWKLCFFLFVCLFVCWGHKWRNFHCQNFHCPKKKRLNTPPKGDKEREP